MAQAVERRETPAESHLLDQLLLAEYWFEGTQRSSLSGLVNAPGPL